MHPELLAPFEKINLKPDLGGVIQWLFYVLGTGPLALGRVCGLLVYSVSSMSSPIR